MGHWAGNYEIRLEVNGGCISSGVTDTIEEALQAKDRYATYMRERDYTETQYTRYKVCLKKDKDRARITITELTANP